MTPTASGAPPAVSTPSPTAVAGQPVLAVLATLGGNDKSPITISLVTSDGHTVASTTASAPGRTVCTPSAGAILPVPLATSTTARRVYFLEGDAVRFLQADGATGTATHVPVSSQVSSVFAVSGDDRRIAVSVIDFAHPGAITLYVEDLAGGNHLEIYKGTSGSVLWPLGWHGGNLVTAVVGPCSQGGIFLAGLPTEVHLADPGTGVRIRNLGTDCSTPYPPTPAGVVCIGAPGLQLVDWSASVTSTLARPEANFFGFVAESPNGRYVAISTFDGPSPGLTVRDVQNREVFAEASTSPWNAALGFIDDDHLVIGDYGPGRPHIVTISTRASVPVTAAGIFVGTLPGGLDR